MQRIEGDVLQVKCSACAVSFPTFVFSGDTDMATSGLEAATSVEPPFIVLGRLNQDELSVAYAEGRERFAERTARRFGRRMISMPVVRWVQGPSADGKTFQQFRRIYRPAEPIYSCPTCGADAAVVIRQTPAEFIAAGGRLELTDGLELA